MENELAPIALFVYNRPFHTRQTVAYLQQNQLAGESDLYVFSDAAKPGNEENVQEVRNFIKQIAGFKSVTIVEREKNYGLANSIIDGVTDLTNKYGKVIVFEDDLLSSPYTLRYFNEALKRYSNEEKVMHISAYMYPLHLPEELEETFFYRVAHSWGWATWKSAWSKFNPDINELERQFDQQKIVDFSIDGTMNFWKQVQEFKKGKNNSWAIRWYASMFLNGGLSLNPSKSLINNIGHDGSGIHSNIENMYDVAINLNPIEYFPEEIKENPIAYEKVKRFLAKRKGNIFKRIVRYIRNHVLKA